MSNTAQRSFVGGELAPGLYARADVARYGTGLRTCRNMVVMRAGGATKRPGTKIVIPSIGSADDHWIIHTFPTAGTYTFTVTAAPSGAKVRGLLVAGGGSGGSVDGTGVAAGGGGAGGVIDNAAIAVAVGSYPISVGSGGVAAHADHTIGIGSASGNKGLDTTGFGLTAKGGGAGHSHDATPTTVCDGGSGGGVESTNEDLNGNGTMSGPFPGGHGTTGQGHDGGQSKFDPNNFDFFGGGGGGAGAAGSNYVTGAAGDGVSSDITGTPTYYGGGGGAGYIGSGTNGGPGGLGGGGHGGSPAVVSGPGRPGTDGLGGGGGGGGGSVMSDGSRGGDGITIVRYKASSGITASGGTMTTLAI